jgi:hypothetical protein
MPSTTEPGSYCGPFPRALRLGLRRKSIGGVAVIRIQHKEFTMQSLLPRPTSLRLIVRILFVLSLLACAGSAFPALATDYEPFLGDWDLNLPGGSAGWLSVAETDGQLVADILWGGGSVVPVEGVSLKDGQLVLVRDPSSNPQTITAKVNGDTLQLTVSGAGEDGKNVQQEFAGKRTPPVPPTPDLSKVKFGEPVTLFDGKDLSGWKLINPRQTSGWKVRDGVLVNQVEQEKGKPHKSFGNLRTEKEFEDFNLTLETRVAEGGNSGVYLRGIYEVQVVDSYGRPLDSHNMGAIYSRICPSETAEKPAGEWQTLNITLVDRHVTVILNGEKIIDNKPLAGCTGGALWSDQLRPGPIYLQGDHTGIEYRNIVLRPLVK